MAVKIQQEGIYANAIDKKITNKPNEDVQIIETDVKDHAKQHYGWAGPKIGFCVIHFLFITS